jgi:hypothetical protein
VGGPQIIAFKSNSIFQFLSLKPGTSRTTQPRRLLPLTSLGLCCCIIVIKIARCVYCELDGVCRMRTSTRTTQERARGEKSCCAVLSNEACSKHSSSCPLFLHWWLQQPAVWRAFHLFSASPVANGHTQVVCVCCTGWHDDRSLLAARTSTSPLRHRASGRTRGGSH